MTPLVLRLGVAAIALATVVACNNTSTLTQVTDLPAGTTLLTSADVRAVNRIAIQRDGTTGAVVPAYITCAEPSPDVAKAVAEAFSLSASLTVKGLPSGVSPQAAAAYGRAQSESIAQLGERLATIQLLRDGLYRACEGYANGAISETIYAVMVSRYDDTMITMLSSELASGAFGRSLAALESESGASSAASADFAEKREERLEAERTLKQKRSETREIARSLKAKRKEESDKDARFKQAVKRNGQARAAVQTAGPETSGEVKDSLEHELERSNKEVAKLEMELEETQSEIAKLESEHDESERRVREAKEESETKLKAESESRSKATATAAGGITPGQQNPEIAEVLHRIQRKYVENINTDAMEIACLAAMDRNATGGLAAYCKDSLLKALVEHKSLLLEAVLKRAWREQDYADNKARILEVGGDLKNILGVEQKASDIAKAVAVKGDAVSRGLIK